MSRNVVCVLVLELVAEEVEFAKDTIDVSNTMKEKKILERELRESKK